MYYLYLFISIYTIVGDPKIHPVKGALQGDSQSDARRKQRLPGELAMDVAHAGPVAPGAPGASAQVRSQMEKDSGNAFFWCWYPQI